MSAFGTKRTFAAPQHFVRYWTRADIEESYRPWPRRVGSAWLAQEAEERRCYRSLIKIPDRISERPPRGGLSILGASKTHSSLVIRCQRYSPRLIDAHQYASSLQRETKTGSITSVQHYARLTSDLKHMSCGLLVF